MLNKEECMQKVEAYFIKNQDRYSPSEIAYIKGQVARRVPVPTTDPKLQKIFAEIGIPVNSKSMYQEFIDILKQNFPIDRNIVEVAGGKVPHLARKIALSQNRGTITVYDPRLIINTSTVPNMLLKPELFTENTDVSSAEMLIGFMPCDATDLIVETACKNNIDFMVALCEGGMRKGYEYIEYDDEWIYHVQTNAINHMKNTTLGELHTASLEEFNNPYPIIYNKRKNLN